MGGKRMKAHFDQTHGTRTVKRRYDAAIRAYGRRTILFQTQHEAA
jgi:hypothetical protein